MRLSPGIRAKHPSLHNRLGCEVAYYLVCKFLIHNNWHFCKYKDFSFDCKECATRPTRKQENVRGRRLALETTALRSPPMHRRTAFNEQVSWLFHEKTRVLRRSGVIDRSRSLIFLKSKRATPLKANVPLQLTPVRDTYKN